MRMKRFFQIFTLAFTLLLPSLSAAAAVPASALGAPVRTSVVAIDIFNGSNGICNGKNDTGTNAGQTDVCKEGSKKGNPVIQAIRVAIIILSTVIGVTAVVVIILSAFKMIRANGNAQEVSAARSGIIYAVIGLVIAVLAPIIVGYALGRI